MATKVMVDAGHYGTVNRSHIVPEYTEAERMWKLHEYLVEALSPYGIEVGVTRETEEENISPIERGRLSKGYDFFISLHSNTCDNPEVDRAVSIVMQNLYTPVTNTSEALGKVIGTAVRNTMDLSVPTQIYRRLSTEDRDGNGVYDDEYYGVLAGAREVGTPGIIMEHSFHTNEKATRWLMVDNNLKKLAEAEAEAMAVYFGLAKGATVTAGCTVGILKDATYTNGKSIPEWVMNLTWVVKKVSKNRAVLGLSADGKKNLNSAIDVSYLVVKSTPKVEEETSEIAEEKVEEEKVEESLIPTEFPCAIDTPCEPSISDTESEPLRESVQESTVSEDSDLTLSDTLQATFEEGVTTTQGNDETRSTALSQSQNTISDVEQSKVTSSAPNGTETEIKAATVVEEQDEAKSCLEIIISILKKIAEFIKRLFTK